MISIKTFSTAPCKEEPFWQIILLPTITILRSPDPFDQYTVVNLEWLFWSLSIFNRPKKKNFSSENSYYTNI